MFRQLGIATLIASLVLATTPSSPAPASASRQETAPPSAAEPSNSASRMQSKVLVVPAGKEMSGTLPDGGKGLSYTSRYALVGANALGLPVILDGINDQGLSVGLFYFPGYAKYADVTKENSSRASRRMSSASGRSPISPPSMR